MEHGLELVNERAKEVFEFTIDNAAHYAAQFLFQGTSLQINGFLFPFKRFQFTFDVRHLVQLQKQKNEMKIERSFTLVYNQVVSPIPKLHCLYMRSKKYKKKFNER